jgi:hypothetical protein
MAKNLHPSIEEFKNFVKKHPKIIREVRNGNKTWKEFYEDWYLFGEEDEIWDRYKEEKGEQKSQDESIVTKVVSSLKNIDIKDMQQYIANVQEAISAIQSVIGQFQGKSSTHVNNRNHPFSFRKD